MGKVTKKKEKVEPTQQPKPAIYTGNVGKYKPIPRFGGCRGC